MKKTEMPRKFYWYARSVSGGNLSLRINIEEIKQPNEKIKALAEVITKSVKFMIEQGLIPGNARLLSSSDIADEFGNTRQYWEKLLNEGKILYKETSAGRITTNLWVKGYLGDKKKVNKYVKDVRIVLGNILKTKKNSGYTFCPICMENNFEYYVNTNKNINGLCRTCNFQINVNV